MRGISCPFYQAPRRKAPEIIAKFRCASPGLPKTEFRHSSGSSGAHGNNDYRHGADIAAPSAKCIAFSV
jgi:hypothetical protein